MTVMNLKYNIFTSTKNNVFFSSQSYFHFVSLCKSYGFGVIVQLRGFSGYYIKHELLIAIALCIFLKDFLNVIDRFLLKTDLF